MTKEERRIAAMVDWSEIEYHTDQIEEYIGKMIQNRLDYTGDIQFHLDHIRDIFEEAEERIKEEVEDEDATA